MVSLEFLFLGGGVWRDLAPKRVRSRAQQSATECGIVFVYVCVSLSVTLALVLVTFHFVFRI